LAKVNLSPQRFYFSLGSEFLDASPEDGESADAKIILVGSRLLARSNDRSRVAADHFPHASLARGDVSCLAK